MVAGAAAASRGGAMRFDRGLHAAGRKPCPRRRRFNQKPFDIYIEHAPAGTEQVSISFSMKNMDMGFNRYMFERQPSGNWQAARIRLPVCVEGRRDFTADITIGSRTFQTAFTAE